MKHTTKTKAKQFLELTREAAERLGFIPFPPDPDFPAYNMNKDQLWTMTDAGIYVVTVHPVTDFWIDYYKGKGALWINGRFRLTNHPNLPRGVGYTGKWNCYGYDPESAVKRFEESMKLVNCRKPTEEERERFEKAENERMEKISEQRKNVVDLTAV